MLTASIVSPSSHSSASIPNLPPISTSFLKLLLCKFLLNLMDLSYLTCILFDPVDFSLILTMFPSLPLFHSPWFSWSGFVISRVPSSPSYLTWYMPPGPSHLSLWLQLALCWCSYIWSPLQISLLIFQSTLSSYLQSTCTWKSHGHFKRVNSALQAFSSVLCKCSICSPVLETSLFTYLLPPSQPIYKYGRFYLLKTSHSDRTLSIPISTVLVKVAIMSHLGFFFFF